MRTKAHRLLFAVIALAFFGTPIALQAVGVRAPAFENRRLAAAPSLADGWTFFDEATRFLIDRMPLRYQAVHANTWIDLHVFHTSPIYSRGGLGGVANDQALPFTSRPDQDKASLISGASAGKAKSRAAQPPTTADQVVLGRDGWLFLQGVFNRACFPFIGFRQAASRWESLLRVIRASGRRAELLVAPDKSTIYSEYVAPTTSDLGCSRPGTTALWKVIESPMAVRAGIIGLRKSLLRAKHTASALLYYRTDSHWNTAGSLTLVEAALPALSRTVRVLPSEIVDPGPVRYSGDLLGLLGESGNEIAPTRRIQRLPGAPVVSGATVLIGDSYADAAWGELAPYFASLRRLYWVNNTTQQLVDGITSSRNVVLETVEREFDYRASDVAYITPAFIARVRKALAALRPR
jgi:alginate O-acetyltransferase complex protein AlgJ